jgi:hypothetical protein
MPRTFDAWIQITEALPDLPTPTLKLKVEIPLSATIMHDNMLNCQRAIEQAVYELFRKYHDIA